MQDILRFKYINKLKSVYRANTVGERNESAAEHSWSALLLADYFLNKTQVDLDRLRVYELLMYHDIVEIRAGDTPLDPAHVSQDQKEREALALKAIAKDLPEEIRGKFLKRFREFEAAKTPEAKFANAIDKFDAMIHQLEYKRSWKGWSEKFLREKKEDFFENFPILHEAFNETLEYMRAKGYFGQ